MAALSFMAVRLARWLHSEAVRTDGAVAPPHSELDLRAVQADVLEVAVAHGTQLADRHSLHAPGEVGRPHPLAGFDQPGRARHRRGAGNRAHDHLRLFWFCSA